MATFPFILQGIRERAGMEHVSIDVCFENPASFEPAVRPQNIFRNIRGGDWRGTVLIYPFPEHTVGADRAEDLRRRRPRVLQHARYRHDRYRRLGRDPRPRHAACGRPATPASASSPGNTRSSATGPPAGSARYVEALFSLGLQFRPDWAINVHKAGPHIKEDGITDQVSTGSARTR